MKNTDWTILGIALGALVLPQQAMAEKPPPVTLAHCETALGTVAPG